MKVGDLVYAKQDLKNGFQVIGLILECRNMHTVHPPPECKILWNSETNPVGWWRINQLQPAIEK